MASGEETKLRLYNTLTRTKEDFVPLDPANVRMYVCGPTVYDFAHIGNARPAIVFDVLFRLLKHLYPGPGSAVDGSRVTYVRNLTDVDDKINARAARDFPGLPLNEAIRKVTETTANQYMKDTAALGCLEPTVQPRATDNIEGMQSLITKLIANQHAYEAAQVGEVLFDVNSMPDYGKLSGRELENNLAGARVEVDAHKRNAADFVLWKASSPEEPGWESPWGRGRPGWHIECSAMSERYLGQVFDIHAGGLDLIFPHHENEIAQSRCAHGTETMARYWMHNGFLQVEGQKMSKSLGNFFTMRELLDGERFGGRAWPGATLRLAMLRTHYRQPIDWTVRGLLEADTELIVWATLAKVLRGKVQPTEDEDVIAALSDDLNTWAVITHLRELNKMMRNPEADDALIRRVGAKFLWGLDLLGIDPVEVADFADKNIDLDAETISALEELLAKREAAKAAKDRATADAVRRQLDAMGFEVRDIKENSGRVVPRLFTKQGAVAVVQS